MTFRIVFRSEAQAEFEDAAAWYEAQRPGLGEEFFLEIARSIEKAAESPLQYPAIFGDVRRTVARRFPFAIYYRVRSESMVVLAIFHGQRDPTVWKERR